MGQVLNQLGINPTLFVQFAIYAVVFFALSKIYFGPFLKLIQARHKKTIQDREAAEKMMTQADEKLSEYTRKLQEARLAAKTGVDAILEQARREESEILGQARNEAKKITQEASSQLNQHIEKLRKDLDVEVEGMSRSVSEKLLLRKI